MLQLDGQIAGADLQGRGSGIPVATRLLEGLPELVALELVVDASRRLVQAPTHVDLVPRVGDIRSVLNPVVVGQIQVARLNVRRGVVA